MSLDAQTNAQQRTGQRLAAAAALILPLNPPFPFRRLALDPFVFGLERDAALNLRAADTGEQVT